MPEVSRFYGVRITMYYQDHLPPHFHAQYGGEEAQILIATNEILCGSLPARAYAMTREWAEQHHAELSENWRRREVNLPLNPIAPLP